MRCANCGNEDENTLWDEEIQFIVLAVHIEQEPLMEKRI